MGGLTSGTNPIVNLGYGLMQAGGPPQGFQNLGSSLLGANAQTIQNQGARQAQGIQSYQLARQKEMWPAYKAMADQIANRFGSGNMSNGTSMGTSLPSQTPNRYDPLPSVAPISANPGSDVALNSAAKFLGMPAPAPEPKDVETALAVQQKQRQQTIAPQLSDLDTIMTSADADKRLQQDPDLKALWEREQGDQPLTPPNARAYAGTVYNRLAGSAQGAVKPIPTMLQTTERGLGESIQTDPVTGKITSGASAVPTDKYIVNGQVTELPKAVAVARGLTPYDSTLYGAQQISPQALEQAYQVAKSKGDISESLAGRDPVAAAKVSSYIAQRAKEDGISGLSMAATQQAYGARQKVVNDYVDSGGTGGKLDAINTSVLHTNSLLPLIDALGTGNMTKINAARLAYQKQTGIAAPTNYETLKNMAVGEISSAVNKTGGDSDERERITAPFASANSPDVLKEAVRTAVTALAGKTEALANRWDVATEGTQGNFGKFLLPQTAQALGWTLHKDAKGNQAYVSADGKYFRQL